MHLAGDLLDVTTNLRGWNEDMAAEDGRRVGPAGLNLFRPRPGVRPVRPVQVLRVRHGLPGRRHGPARLKEQMSTATYSALNDGTHVMDGQPPSTSAAPQSAGGHTSDPARMAGRYLARQRGPGW